MAGTPLFEVTDAGLAAASVATPTGPYIHITSFQVGSGFGYDPQASDTGLNGTLLYTGVPTSYQNIGNGTINIICEIPPDAGPFSFGEIAVFLEGGVMFAKAVFDEPQTKFSSLGTNVVSSYTINCLLKLQQSIAVFQIDTLSGPPAVWEVDKWSDVYPPGISANPDIPLTMVRENNTYGESSLLENTNDSYWTLGTTSYMRYGGAQNRATFPVANASTTWIEFAASTLRSADLTTVNRRFVIKTSDGFYRSVASVVQSGSNYRFNLNPDPLLNTPSVNSAITIYRDDQRGGTLYYGQIVDPPTIPPQYVLPPATTSTRGGVIVGNNLTVDGNGRISAPAPYSLPIANAGQLGGVKIGSGIVEAGDGTISVPPNTYTPSGGVNSMFSFAMPAGGAVIINGGGNTIPGFTDHPEIRTSRQGICHTWVVDDQSRNTTMSVNGIIVSRNTKDGGGGYGRRHHDTAAFFAGDEVRITGTAGATFTIQLCNYNM